MHTYITYIHTLHTYVRVSSRDWSSFAKELRDDHTVNMPTVSSLSLSISTALYVCMYVCMYGRGGEEGCFKIVHEKYRAKNADDEADQYQRKFQEGLKLYPELKPQTLRAMVRIFVCMYSELSYLSNIAQELLTPMRSYELMQNLIDEDLSLLWMSGTYIYTYIQYIHSS